MCSICGCELPINRSGHVLRETRRSHNQGTKHQARLSAIARDEENERLQRHRQWLTELHAKQLKRRQERRLAIALGVLATRLRARHGSMEGARNAWAEAADAQLQSVKMPELRLKLHGPTKETLAWHEMQTIVAIENHELFRLLFEELSLVE